MTTLRTLTKPVAILFAIVFGAATLTACDQEGPLEQAGEKADEVVQDTKRAVEDAAD